MLTQASYLDQPPPHRSKNLTVSEPLARRSDWRGRLTTTNHTAQHRRLSSNRKSFLRLHALRDDHPNDGYRRMTLQLQAEGFHVNRKRIARLMALHSLTKKQSRPGNLAPRFV